VNKVHKSNLATTDITLLSYSPGGSTCRELFTHVIIVMMPGLSASGICVSSRRVLPPGEYDRRDCLIFTARCTS